MAVTLDSERWLVSHTVQGRELAHIILSAGEPVLAAGEAEIAGSGGKLKNRLTVIELLVAGGQLEPNQELRAWLALREQLP